MSRSQHVIEFIKILEQYEHMLVEMAQCLLNNCLIIIIGLFLSFESNKIYFNNICIVVAYFSMHPERVYKYFQITVIVKYYIHVILYIQGYLSLLCAHIKKPQFIYIDRIFCSDLPIFSLSVFWRPL